MNKKELKLIAELVVRAVKRELPKVVRKELKEVLDEQMSNGVQQNGQANEPEEFSFMNENTAMNITEDDDDKTKINKILQQTPPLQEKQAGYAQYAQGGGGQFGPRARQQQQQQPQMQQRQPAQQQQQQQPQRQPKPNVDPSKFGYGNMNDMKAGSGRFDDPNYGFQDGANQQQQQQGGRQQINAQQGHPQQQQQQPQAQSHDQMPSFIQNAVNNAKNVVDQSKQRDGSRRSFMPGG